MDDKHLHIEEWLKKAAQQPAPDNGQELKRQAWSGMAAMLDKEQDADTQPAPRQPLRWFLPRRAALIISLGAAACALTTWLIWQASDHTAQQTPADTARVFAGPAATLPTSPAAAAARQDTASGRLPARAFPLPSAINEAVQQAPGATALPDTAAAPLTMAGRPAFHPSTQGNSSLPLSAGPGTVINASAGQGNEPVMPSPAIRVSQPGAPLFESTGERAATGGRAEVLPKDAMSNNHLRALSTINLYALQVPALSADSQRRQLPVPPAAVLADRKTGARRWALQAGLLYPFSGAYGINAGLLYTLPLGAGWSLQPEVNAGFMTGYDKHFDHQVLRNTRIDTISGGIPLYRKDTISTPYILQRAFMGAAGIQLAYTTRKVTLRTGLVYSYALPGGRRDSAVTSSGAVTADSLNLQTESGTPAFNTRRLPGIQQLSWSLDAAYQVNPRIQAGIRYRAALLRSGGDDGFKGPAKAVQDNSLLELYLRIPLGR